MVAARSGSEIHAILTNQILEGKFLFEPATAKLVERVWFLVSALLLLTVSYFFANRIWLLLAAGIALSDCGLGAGAISDLLQRFFRLSPTLSPRFAVLIAG